MKTLRILGLVLLIVISILCFWYLNYCPEANVVGEMGAKSSELTDVRISKFIMETLRKVTISAL